MILEKDCSIMHVNKNFTEKILQKGQDYSGDTRLGPSIPATAVRP